MSEESENFLAHYGVLGMKWGHHKRQDDPSGKRVKAVEISEKNKKKAQKYHDKVAFSKQTLKEMDELGIQSPKMRELYGRAVNQDDRLFAITYGMTKDQALRRERNNVERTMTTAEKDAAAKEQGKLSKGQKIAIGSAVVAGTLLVAYGAYKYPDIVTRNAQPGEAISVNNFLKRYGVRSDNFIRNPITKEAFHAMDDEDIHVPSGATFRRLTAFKNEDLNRRLYTTFTQEDNDRYQGIYGAALRQRTPGNKGLYINEMVMHASIKSPSEKKRVQILMDLLDKDPQNRKDLIDLTGIGLYNPQHHNSVSSESLALKHYNTFARAIVMDNPLGEKYMKHVKDLGYNALVDDNDAKQLSDLPMILLDAANTTKNRTSKLLTPEMEKAARKRLVEILE